MVIMISLRHPPGRLPGAGAWTVLIIVPIALSWPGRAAGADWTVIPSLRLRETYSDNVYLAPASLAQADAITDISPGVTIIGNSPRLHLNFSYALQQLIYARGQDTRYHQLAANGDAELLENWLYADANATISRQSISAFGAQVVDDTQRSDNQERVSTSTISPYIRHRVPALATAELRYTHAAVDSGDDLLKVKTDEYMLKIAGDNSGTGWNWNINADQRTIKDSALAPVRMTTASFSLSYAVSSHLNLFATLGHEHDDYVAATPEQPQGRFWSAGAGWYPSSRSSLVVSIGRRFFGNTYSIDALHSSRHTTWSLSYSEDITTTQAQLQQLSRGDTAGFLDQLWSVSIPDRAQRQLQIAAFLRLAQLLGPQAGAVSYFSHNFYLQKQLGLNVVAATAKTVLSFGATRIRRDAQTNSGIDSILLGPGTLALQDQTLQTGATAGWSWRASGRDNLNLGLAWSSITSLTRGRKDRNLALSAGLSRRLGPNVTGSVDLRRVSHGSTDASSAYRENAISAAITMQF
jgi:uncharacterized protein (PEP-CTERM system associated)